MKVLIIVLIIGFLFGCGLSEQSTGSLSVNVDPGASIMQIGPPIPMACVEYELSITGPTAIAPITIGVETATFEDLLPGNYDIVVIGNNSETTAIGEGSDSVTVTIGGLAVASIVVAEYTDTPGSLHLDLSWVPAGEIFDPGIDIFTKDSSGAETAMIVSELGDPVVGAAKADLADMAVGFHGVVAKLYDGVFSSGGFATLARICNGLETSGAVVINANPGSGDIQVDITTDFFEDLDLTADLAEGDYDLYANIPITVTASSGESILIFWYLDGELVGTDLDYTIDGAALVEEDTYRLDALAWSLDGKRAGDLTFEFTAKPALAAEQMSIEATTDLGHIACWWTVTLPPTPGGSNGAIYAEVEGFLDDVFTSGAPDPGDYRLYITYAAGDFYYDESTGWTTDGPESTPITIPESSDTVYNLGSPE